MWKKRSRNKIDLLLDFLKFTYENSYEKADRSTICELAGKVDDLIYYQDIEKDTFEVEDIIVTQVFQYYSSEPSDDLLATEKKAIKAYSAISTTKTDRTFSKIQPRSCIG